ncbi:MAG: flagellar motor switch protein FliG [Syntrophorhabdaceae bacterium]|nr:flagellar motor switch protein FliG [Syntrophorhabdaceae bacterium]
MNASDISGVRKAAILLLTLDEEISKEVLKELDQDEIETIGQEISRLKIVSEDVVKLVHEEFMKEMERINKIVTNGETKFKELIKKSLGEEKAEQLFESIGTKEGTPGDFLKTCDARLLANTLRGEHPQTIALVFSVLSSKKACEAIANLPENLQGEVIMRMAKLEKVDNNILLEVENIIREQIESVGFVEGRQLGGVDVVANILNQMDKTMEEEIMNRLEESNPELAERIRQLMFTFEDLLHLDDKGIQILLKEISSEDLTLALKGASENIKTKIFANMSERASAMLKEDLEAMGPVRLSEVEQAQVRIAMTAKKLDSEGKITISRGNEKFI